MVVARGGCGVNAVAAPGRRKPRNAGLSAKMDISRRIDSNFAYHGNLYRPWQFRGSCRRDSDPPRSAETPLSSSPFRAYRLAFRVTPTLQWTSHPSGGVLYGGSVLRSGA
jgi:hypothetical protein